MTLNDCFVYAQCMLAQYTLSDCFILSDCFAHIKIMLGGGKGDKDRESWASALEGIWRHTECTWQRDA